MQGNLPAFAPEGDIIFIILDGKYTWPPMGETLSLSFKAVCHANLLKKIVWNKKPSMPLPMRLAET